MRKIFSLMAAVLAVFSVITPAFAQDATTVLGGVLPWLAPVLEGLLGKYGVAATIVMWIGVLRFAFKPIFEMWHSVAAATPTLKDDAFLAKVEASKTMKVVLFVLDWMASLKFKK